MGTIAFRLAKQALPGDVTNAAVVSVRQIGDATGRYPEVPFETRVHMPAGQHQENSVENLPDGTYRLEARLPDGKVISRNATVTGNDRCSVEFDAGRSPHEWLSWQKMSGALPPRESRPDVFTGIPSLGVDDLASTDDHFLDSGYSNEFSDEGASTEGAGGGGAMKGLAPRTRGGPPTLGYREAILPPADPRRLPSEIELTLTGPDGGPLTIGTARQGLQLVDDNADGEVRLWRFTTSYQGSPPRMIAVDWGEGVSTVTIPAPWNGAETIDLLYDRQAKGIPVRVDVRDRERSAILSYLGAGLMAEAAAAAGRSDLSGDVTRLIQEKTNNPLAAAAGAYIALATPGAQRDVDTWLPWLGNLENWFTWLPDGPIVRARATQINARSADAFRDSLASLKAAAKRGQPYFAAGFQHLLAGLLPFAQRPEAGLANPYYDKEAAALHATYSELALRVDSSQPFTVMTRYRS